MKLKKLLIGVLFALGTNFVYANCTTQTLIVGGKLQSILDTPEKIQLRLNKDVDLLKRTAAGEQTAYTPMVDFISKNDAATVKMRTEFSLGDETSHVAAALMAGKSPSEITLSNLAHIQFSGRRNQCPI